MGNSRLTCRRGLPIRVLKDVFSINRPKLKALLEDSFGRKLNGTPPIRVLSNIWTSSSLRAIMSAAIVTNEAHGRNISYLDKFAVLPDHQGDSTVDFLWVALHDESFGLGRPSSVNPHGGKED